MSHRLLTLTALLGLATSAHAQLRSDGATASFKGSLPPKPTSDLSSADQATLEKELAEATTAFQSVKGHANAADAEIFLKAVRYAIEGHEWYDKKPGDSLKKAHELLAEATRRIESLKAGKTSWLSGAGTKVVGYYSKIDGSAQPYGVDIPEGLTGSADHPVPMWIWLHGRGDTSTDISFDYGMLKGKGGPFKPKTAIVIHPFGRFCNGWKSAGEIDVLESRDDALKRFHGDPDRIALAGFSMGGAGAWHLGAHFAGNWAVVHTGAGFVDVKRYQKLTPERYPAPYEQTLWGAYDVPDYARNFFNTPLLSYSGEIDTQRDSANYMAEVLAKEGYTLQQFIGPKMPHKYDPAVRENLEKLIEAEVAKGNNRWPSKVTLQTRTLAYPDMKWVHLVGLEHQWEDSRVDAERLQDGSVRATTRNATALLIDAKQPGGQLLLDGVNLGAASASDASHPGWACLKENGAWKAVSRDQVLHRGLAKAPGVQGPIDDAFKSHFIVVLPEHSGWSPKVDAWAAAESAHFLKRWTSLMRGDAIVKKASEVTAADVASANIILWGDPASNSIIAKILPKLPLQWSASGVAVGTQKFDAQTHVPVLCYPNPANPSHYVVINSGLTFREAHDKTNSLQNPKLPDWAVLDITTPPDAEKAGKVAAADFFDEQWQVKPAKP